MLGGPAHIMEGTAATQKDLKHQRGTFMSQQNLYEIPQELVQSSGKGNTPGSDTGWGMTGWGAALQS